MSFVLDKLPVADPEGFQGGAMETPPPPSRVSFTTARVIIGYTDSWEIKETEPPFCKILDPPLALTGFVNIPAFC